MLNLHNKASYRITHIPTGITVECSLYRSQHQNRDACLKILRQKLWALENIDGYKEFTLHIAGDEVFRYTLSDGVECPDKLDEYKDGAYNEDV